MGACVVCSLCFLHSSHKFKQYLVSCFVLFGIPFSLALNISAAVFGGAKRVLTAALEVGGVAHSCGALKGPGVACGAVA